MAFCYSVKTLDFYVILQKRRRLGNDILSGTTVEFVGSKQLIKNTTDPKEKRRHILIYNFKVYLGHGVLCCGGEPVQ